MKTAAKRALLTGFALTIPIFVTLLVIGFVVNFLSNVLDPVVIFAFEATGSRLQQGETSSYLLKIVALALLLATIFSIGFVSERRSGSSRIEAVFDATIQRIPGIGSIYTSFDEMSEMLLDSDTQSFQEVVLIEHPTPESYTVAFVTASTPDYIERATDSGEMVTVFMPMAPNPVMGGHVVHVPTERVYDVDMTVEEGIRSIVTSGVAIGESGVSPTLGGTPDDAEVHYPPQGQYQPGAGRRAPTPDTEWTDRQTAYAQDMDLEHAETPDAIARRRQEETVGDDTVHPDGLDQESGTLGDDTGHPDELDQESGTLGDDTGRPDDLDQADGTVGSETATPADIESDEKEQN
jgi:uncharacterized membrane protein